MNMFGEIFLKIQKLKAFTIKGSVSGKCNLFKANDGILATRLLSTLVELILMKMHIEE